MVCLGNICRSPLAEGILKQKCAEHGLDWEVDSAGTSGYHDGELPDSRSIDVAKDHGVDITDQRSRRLTKEDLVYYDLVFAMDSSNYNNIRKLGGDLYMEKVALILNMAYPGMNMAVPDPYYEGGFDKVYEMLEEACEKIILQHKN